MKQSLNGTAALINLLFAQIGVEQHCEASLKEDAVRLSWKEAGTSPAEYAPLRRLEEKLRGSLTVLCLATKLAKTDEIGSMLRGAEKEFLIALSGEHGQRLSIGGRKVVDRRTLKWIRTLAVDEIRSCLQDMLAVPSDGNSEYHHEKERVVNLVDDLLSPTSPDNLVFDLKASKHGHAVDLVGIEDKLSLVKNALVTRIDNDPAGVLGQVEKVRQWVGGAVYWFSSITIRAADILSLDLGSAEGGQWEDVNGTGNVYLLGHTNGRDGLLFSVTVRRTNPYGVMGVIPPLVGRLLVLYLRCLCAICLERVLFPRLRAALNGNEEVRQSLGELNVVDVLKQLATRRLSNRLEISSSFVNKLINAKGPLHWKDGKQGGILMDQDKQTIFDFTQEQCFSCDTLNDVRMTLRRSVQTLLGIDIDVRQIRALFAVLEYLDEPSERDTPEREMAVNRDDGPDKHYC